MEIGDRFLPIGTVVLLKGGKKELMIMGYCIMPSGEVYDKNGKVDSAGKFYDYGACFYPEGMVNSDQMFAFNHDQIEKVCFKGYETDNQKELSYVLNGGLKEIENEKLKNSQAEGVSEEQHEQLIPEEESAVHEEVNEEQHEQLIPEEANEEGQE